MNYSLNIIRWSNAVGSDQIYQKALWGSLDLPPPLPFRYLIISWYSKNKSLLLKSIILITCFNQDVLKGYFLQIVVRIGLFFTTIVMSRKVKGKLCLASHTMYEPRVLKLFVTKILHMICCFRHDRYTTSSVYSEFLQNLADFTSYWIKIRRNSESL